MAYVMKRKAVGPPRDGRNRGVSPRNLERDDRLPARIGGAAWLTLLGLLGLPTFALTRQIDSVDWRILFGVPVAMSVVAFFAYRTDKRRARDRNWRLSESALHTIELLGGWPGAFLAQRRYRHKTAKVSFQLTFWAIVFVHHMISIDSLSGWTFASRVIEGFK